jgi:F0F1-type ATP synthase membrane subunit b/b'
VFLLLFAAVKKVLVSPDGRCLKNKQHRVITDIKWAKGESLEAKEGQF